MVVAHIGLALARPRVVHICRCLLVVVVVVAAEVLVVVVVVVVVA